MTEHEDNGTMALVMFCAAIIIAILVAGTSGLFLAAVVVLMFFIGAFAGIAAQRVHDEDARRGR